MARHFIIYRFNVGQNRPWRKERNLAQKMAGPGKNTRFRRVSKQSFRFLRKGIGSGMLFSDMPNR
jgi:hypothetical protein